MSSSGWRLATEEIIEQIRWGLPDATLEIEECAARPAGRDEPPVRLADLMVPRARDSAKLDQPARDGEFVALPRGLTEDELVADNKRQEAGRFYSLTRPAGAGGSPEDGVLVAVVIVPAWRTLVLTARASTPQDQRGSTVRW